MIYNTYNKKIYNTNNKKPIELPEIMCYTILV